MKRLRWLLFGLIVLSLALLVARFGPHSRLGVAASGHNAPNPATNTDPAPSPARLLSAIACQDGTLPPPAAHTAPPAPAASQLPAVPHARFADWVERFLVAEKTGATASLLAEGQSLAVARREALAREIKLNPRGALARTAPWRWRQALPSQITAYFEEHVSGRGNLDVFSAMPLPGADYREFQCGTMRYATLGGRTYQAYVYGKRAAHMSRRNVAIEGIAIDNLLALREEPLRVLEPDESEAIVASGIAPITPRCALCGSAPFGGQPRLLASYGGRLLDVCCPSHGAELGKTLAQAESSGQVGLASSGGASAGNSWWTSAPPESLAGSFGTKRVLYMRVVFRDDTRVPITEGEVLSIMDEVDNFYKEASYNKTALITTVTPVLTLPNPKLHYSFAGPGALLDDARAEAVKLGFSADNYEQLILQFTTVPGYDWGGLGGGGVAWLQGAGVGLTVHELGHCYGLGHANYWETRRPDVPTNPQLPYDIDSLVGHDSVIGVGDDIAYGDIFDVMGSGGGEGPANTNQVLTAFAGHFNAVGKYLLAWLTDAYVTKVTQDGTNRIYAHDVPRLVDGRQYALRIAKDAEREYWVSARAKVPNRWLTNGVELHWGAWQQAQGYSQLLDTTPGSAHGRQDAAIAVGRTYADEESKTYITTLASGSSGTNLWFDVAVFTGPRTNNSAPVASLTVSTNSTRSNQVVTLAVAATDPDGDPMAFFWDFGDGTVAPNTPTVNKAWTANGDYVVRCEVSDMRGGMTSKHLVVRVGSPDTLRISGFVLDNQGLPLRDVRVSNGSLTDGDYEYASDYQWTYTDSDGAFTLVNLSSGAHAIGAFLNGYYTEPLNFQTPITLAGLDASGIQFIASPLARVTAVTLEHADGPTSKPGVVQLTRTGDTNTALQAFFLVAGSAAPGQDYVDLTNVLSLVTQTNVVSTPFGPATLVFPFFAVDFPTGIVQTNITITPLVTNTPPGGDKDVALTLMYPIEVIRLILTNGEGGILATNTNAVFFSDWEIRSVNGQDTWFQNYTDYVPFWPGQTKVNIAASNAPLPIISLIASSPVTENPIDAGQFTIVRTGPLAVPVTVLLSTEGTAVPGSDYEVLPTSVFLPANVAYANVPVFVRPNLYLDGNRTVTLKITPDESYQVGAGEASVTIMDNDLPLVTITATEPVGSESGSSPAVMLVTRTGDMTRALAVNYLVTGSAVSGADYRTLPGSVTIPAGQPSAAIVVTPRDNGVKDGGKTVQVLLSDSATYNVGPPNTATVFLRDRAWQVVTVTASDNTAIEASETGTFTLTRTGDTTRDLTVRLRTGGTAKPHTDYVYIPETVVIPRLSTTTTVTVTPVDDRLREDSETIILEVLPGTDYYPDVRVFQAMVTLTDDDGSSTLAVGFNFLNSTNLETPAVALIGVSITGNPGEDNPVTVDYKVTGGTAIPDVDYSTVTSTGRLVFVNGPDSGNGQYTNRTQLIPFSYTNDLLARPDRTIVLSLLAPPPFMSNWLTTNEITITNMTGEPEVTNEVVTNSMIVTIPMNAYFDVYTNHTLTILDDDASVVTIEATDAVAREQGLDPGIFTIRRTVVTNRAQTVRLQVSGLAANGSDYQPIPSTVEIPAGFDSLPILVIPVDDPTQEYIEEVKITLLEVPGAQLGSTTSATVSVMDNDGTIEFTRTAYTTYENAPEALIPVHRTSDTNSLVTVDYTVSAGTATAGVDFVVTNGTLTFAPGQALQHMPVQILDDLDVEPGETLYLTLLNAGAGAPLGGQTTATLTIVDDDTAVEFSSAQYLAYENSTNAVITLRRIGVVTNAASVDIATTNGTALGDVDFVSTNATIVFNSGQTTLDFSIRVLDNTLVESNKTVLLTLATNASHSTSIGPQDAATLSIVENDCAFQFSVTNYTVIEHLKVVTLDVQRLGGTVHPAQVDYTTTNGTAMAGQDYQATFGTLLFDGDANVLAPDGSGTIVFQPGDTNLTLQVRILDDNLGEGDENFGVVLTGVRTTDQAPTNTIILGGTTNASVSILDDELPGQVDFSFNPGLGADAPVYALAVQPDGKVLLGGAFTSVDGIILNHIARLHEDGYLDSFLTPGAGADDDVHAIAVQADGRVLIGGAFLSVNGVARTRIARLNADGAVHDGFDPGYGPDGLVRALAVQSDGGIVLGGDFSTISGVSRAGIARLATTGAIDTTFDPGSGAPGGVHAVAVQSDGKILLAGAFTSAAGATRPWIARLNPDGSADASFNPGLGPNGIVRSLAVLSDGRIIIGGDFTSFSGIARHGVARLNADGSLDAAFDPLDGADDAVHAVGAQPDGKVTVAGAFTTFAGLPASRYVRLNPNGTVDTSFQIGTGANDLVRAMVVQPNTAIVIGGDFTVVNGLDRNRIARIHGDEKFLLNTIQFSEAVYRVPEDGANAVIALIRGGDIASAVSVDYTTVDGTAEAGVDYQETKGTLRFDAGETAKTFSVPVFDNVLAEGDKTIGLLLTNLPSGFSLSARLNATLVIEDNESALAFAAAAFSFSEGAGAATIVVRRTGPATIPASVDYETRDDTAVAGEDYVAASGTLSFEAGEVEKSFDVTLIDDDQIEPDKTVVLALSNPVGGPVLGLQATALLTITDNDRVDFYNLSISPPVGGSVTPPSGQYAAGSVIVVLADPARDYHFDQWTGSVNSAANPLILVMDRNYNLTALFKPIDFTYTFEPPFSQSSLATAPWASSTPRPWLLQSATAAGGRFALRSGATGDGQDSILTLVAHTRTGAGSFDMRVSSEANWDFFEFYLNGVKIDRWSGEVPWRSYQFNLVAGQNTLSWRYVKDNNFSSGLDAAFMDNLFLPLDTPDPTDPAAHLSVVTLPIAGFNLELVGRSGNTYITQSTTNLLDWQPISTNTLIGTRAFINDPQPPVLQRRFYRAYTE